MNRTWVPSGLLEQWVRRHVTESNRIEGINRLPTEAEVQAHLKLLGKDKLSVQDIVQFVEVVAPHAIPRFSQSAHNVRVGDHVAPPSGPQVFDELELIIKQVNGKLKSPWQNHVEYEMLHPFTDGNGRSGRAIWLWEMYRDQQHSALARGFLHSFYYQTLKEMG